MKVLVTGTAGFIGFHLATRLLRDGFDVYGIDNLNDYYDVNLKKARLDRLLAMQGFSFSLLDLADSAAVAQWFPENRMDSVVSLAAQPRARYSLAHHLADLTRNLVGF